MKIDKVSLKGFRCFGPRGTKVKLQGEVTAFVGTNGSGKTAVFLGLSRLFGVTPTQRAVRRQDFHVPADHQELQSGATLSIEVVFSFPELEGLDEDEAEDAVPEFFLQMAASAPDAPLKARMRLQATWTDDGTPDGSIDEYLRWITTLDDEFEWDECKRVQAVERGSIQLIYVPAARDAATQVTALLKGRLWQAAKWSDKFRDSSAASAQGIQRQFEREEPAEFIIERLTKRWRQVHEADTDTTPVLRLVEGRFEELVRKAEFAFSPDEAGQERALADLSDGQRSLFHIALTATTLEVEKDVFTQAADESAFDQDKLRRTSLTFLAIEEPENSLSPFFLSRTVAQAREIGTLASAQVALSSHSPAILSRIEPEEVRYFRLNRARRRAYVRRITMPEGDDEASQYVRLAIRAYPELYFARFVILGEGDSERLVIPRVADAMGVQLDPSFVPIVPLGGRYVSHFWRLLNDLRIPHATLLDLDLGRAHGGATLIADIVEKLKEIDNDLSENSFIEADTIDPNEVDDVADSDLLDEGGDHDWLRALREEGVFLSFPLDIDFAMIGAFPESYQHPNPGGRGPRGDADTIRDKKAVTLKTGGDPNLYDYSYDDEFKWYPYLFLSRSKPETHIAALARIEQDELAEGTPAELKALIEHVKEALDLEDGAE
ncbi:AAA family ATPase [Pelagibius litoralis]|uniref:AAA family ATPase n=1 Tax=Pelagibius litoralis TaxID=374515 RepID=A0A967F0N5_9PROT|nr:TOPRIM nucleotidyl transferase/hydrolase domain-containing protein [Pelagibius litoralis]NIA70983.1 AAA family ATPase [Pelagibius litoralis]